VTATAFDGSTVLMRERIGLVLLAGDVIERPASGDTNVVGRRLRLRSERVRTATSYCWTLSQGGSGGGEICTDNRRLTIARDNDVLAGLGPGPLAVTVTAYREGTVIGRDTVGITLVAE